MGRTANEHFSELSISESKRAHLFLSTHRTDIIEDLIMFTLQHY
jgi:hypothetical protein